MLLIVRITRTIDQINILYFLSIDLEFLNIEEDSIKLCESVKQKIIILFAQCKNGTKNLNIEKRVI